VQDCAVPPTFKLSCKPVLRALHTRNMKLRQLHFNYLLFVLAFNTIAEVHSAPRHRNYGSLSESRSVPISSPVVVVEEANNENDGRDATVVLITASNLPTSDNCEEA